MDESAVSRLMELGWTRAQARVGLRGAAGDPDRAHLQLAARADQRAQHRRDRYTLWSFESDSSSRKHSMQL